MRSMLPVIVLGLTLTACGSLDYKPVQTNTLQSWAKGSCGDKGEKATFTATVKRASEDHILVWDGIEGDSELMAQFPEPGWKDKWQDAVGDNKYEASAKLLKMVAAENGPIDITLLCRGHKKSPEVVRYTYDDDGDKKTFEFE